MFIVDLSKYFTAQKIAKRFESMPPIKSTVLDLLFPEAVREQYESPVIPISEIAQTINVVPVVHRGSASIPLDGDTQLTGFVEPLPVRIHTQISAKDLNDMKLLGESSREKWAKRRQEKIRRTVRLNTEVFAAQAVLDGKISFPLLQSNGQYQMYEVTYQGQTIQSVNVASTSKWNATEATLVKVYELLEDMADALDNEGYGGDKVTLAGKTAYSALLALIEDLTEKPKVPVRVSEKGEIIIGGHTVRKLAESYRNPKTGATVKKLADGEIRMISKGYTSLFYAAVDDLDANLHAMPMFVKPIPITDPSGYKLVGESKPLPAVAPKATCKAIVIA
ncbi:major capsid protein [Dethiosulfatarculus sandiegensis]|uniref:major capsid protein n=1 Tax=Dethiosulfatarculus sandiegensis TaxID=1429043 RepID=UPI0009EACE19|nr:major capsid protein [Dethiosulfatarculus sandiegensis]